MRISNDVPERSSAQRSVTVRSRLTQGADGGKYLITDLAGGPQTAWHPGSGSYSVGERVTARFDSAVGQWVLPTRSAGGTSVYHDGQWSYDFAVQGGAIGGPYPLTAVAGEASIPSGSYIVDGYLVGQTVLASATDSAAFSVDIEGVGDLVDPSSPSGYGFHIPGGGPLSGIIGFDGKRFASSANIDNSASSFIHTTAARVPAVTNAVEAVTQGKFQLFLRWVTP